MLQQLRLCCSRCRSCLQNQIKDKDDRHDEQIVHQNGNVATDKELA